MFTISKWLNFCFYILTCQIEKMATTKKVLIIIIYESSFSAS